MDLDEYQWNVMRTANRGDYPEGVPEAGRLNFDLMTWGLGVAGEAGEVADLLKKGIGHGHGLDRGKMIKELGDVLWYVAALASGIGMPLNAIAFANVEKLRARYPDGFTVEASKAKADEGATPDQVKSWADPKKAFERVFGEPPFHDPDTR